MELQQFVELALTQIVAGVAAAAVKVGEQGGSLNPSRETIDKVTAWARAGRGFVPIENIEFDVAVTASDSKEGSAGVGISVFGAKVGATGQGATENTTVSRVKFSVPMVLPIGKG